MGSTNAAPINEVMALQEILDSTRIETFRQQYPDLSDELRVGRWAGPKDEKIAIARSKAAVVVEVLRESENCCRVALERAAARIQRQRCLRIAADLIALCGASSVIGALGLKQPTIAMITAVITLSASAIKMVSEFVSVAPGASTKGITASLAYQRLAKALPDIQSTRLELEVLLQHDATLADLTKVIGQANALCRAIVSDTAAFLVGFGA